MTTIRIADDFTHPRAQDGQDEGNTTAVGESIYRMRTLNRARSATFDSQDDGIYNIRARRVNSGLAGASVDRRSLSSVQDVEDEDPGLGQEGDYKQKQVFRGWPLIVLSFQSVGVIYGDIGTSPLYVFSSCFSAPPSKQDLVGVLSLVIWSLTMMVTLKYVLVILYADNSGEGGTFSTYSLLSRFMNITNRDPREASLIKMERIQSQDLESAGRHIRRGLEHSKFAKGLLKVMGIFAVTMVLADGVLTPAQSVLGAVQGIEVVDSTISKSTIIGVTDAILLLLFFIQPLGISRLTIAFAPIITIWLAFNAGFGINNLVHQDWTVLKAFNPGHAFEFLIRHKEDGWRTLGGVLLAFTGVEALFADLGAFSRPAIQLSWLTYIYPCLLLAYTGQAAFISDHPEAYSNPFFNSVPHGLLIPSLIVAILAAIVASQAIITATFQLLSQAMKLSYVPQVKVVHTSKIYHGQLYMPVANWLLMIGTVLVASIYNNTTSLGNAYGVCVMFVTFFDSTMVSLCAMFVWNISPWKVALPWLTIACLDCAFLSSALTKVPDGAWFTITIAIIMAMLFLLWRFGKEQQWFAEAEDRFPTSHFVQADTEGDLRLAPRFGGSSLSVIKGFGIFFDKAGETAPIVFSNFALKLNALPEVMVFFHLRPLEVPSVPLEERHTVTRLAIPNCYRLVVRYGFNDEVVTPDLAAVIYEQVRRYLLDHAKDDEPIHIIPGVVQKPNTSPDHISLMRRKSDDANPSSGADGRADETTKDADKTAPTTETTSTSTPDKRNVKHLNTSIDIDLATLDEAYNHKVLYIVGKEQMKIKPKTNYFRSTLLWTFLWLRDNTRNKIANLKVPTDDLIEVGFLKLI